jgi:hypothetical protein
MVSTLDIAPNSITPASSPPDSDKYMKCIIRDVVEIEFHPSNMNREDGLCLSKSWKPLIYSL